MGTEARHVKDVAKAAGVTPLTLRRWLLDGKVSEVSRDRNGWRLFTPEEESAIVRYALKKTPPKKVIPKK
jgi:DNA (cytosine-5)-methyltransferase 1